MAKVKIRHEGKVQVIDLDESYTKQDRELLKKLGIIEEEVKPTKKKKAYKNTEHKKDEDSSTEVDRGTSGEA